MADHDSKPAELTEAQIDALADAGNRALNDHYHEDLCHCSDWPESCASSGHYFAGSWDTAAFSIGMAAVIGAWESMRAAPEADELARLRDAAAGVPEVKDPARSLDLLALMPERSAAIVSGHLARLLGEQARLRARVAELEALKPAAIQDCRKCGAGYEHGQPCSNCDFQAQMAALAATPKESK
jgi:hypothetical protein